MSDAIGYTIVVLILSVPFVLVALILFSIIRGLKQSFR